MIRLIFVLLVSVVFGLASLASQAVADDPFAELANISTAYEDCIQATYRNPMFDLGVVPTWQSREQAQAAADCAGHPTSGHLEQPTAEKPKAGAGNPRN